MFLSIHFVKFMRNNNNTNNMQFSSQRLLIVCFTLKSFLTRYTAILLILTATF